MIESFADPEAEKIFNGIVSRKLPLLIQQTARRRLVYFDDADDLRDLLASPGNRLEALHRDREGQDNITIILFCHNVGLRKFNQSDPWGFQ